MVYNKEFLGQSELPDLLDSNESKFFGTYYFVLSSDSDTKGIIVTTGSSCSVTSQNLIGRN